MVGHAFNLKKRKGGRRKRRRKKREAQVIQSSLSHEVPNKRKLRNSFGIPSFLKKCDSPYFLLIKECLSYSTLYQCQHSTNKGRRRTRRESTLFVSTALSNLPSSWHTSRYQPMDPLFSLPIPALNLA